MNQDTILAAALTELQLLWPRQHYQALADQAAQAPWSHTEYLQRLLEGECQRRRQNRIERRIAAARFPVLKTLETFNWSWPKKINRPQVQHLARLAFLADHTNVILLGGVGLGKTHLAIALGYLACQAGHHVLFTTAVGMINNLLAAQATHRLKTELARYVRPRLLVLDEVGYLPLDQQGAELLFQVISERYERGSTVLTTNKPFKQWAAIFHNDSGMTSAVLDRLVHHAEMVLLEGTSYRLKDRLET